MSTLTLSTAFSHRFQGRAYVHYTCTGSTACTVGVETCIHPALSADLRGLELTTQSGEISLDPGQVIGLCSAVGEPI